jgi:hypothetical protein
MLAGETATARGAGATGGRGGAHPRAATATIATAVLVRRKDHFAEPIVIPSSARSPLSLERCGFGLESVRG